MSGSARARLILVRHGETAANREMRYIGSRDDELTNRGKQQAQQLAAALQAFPITAVYSSPRRRAQATAAPIAVAHGLAVSTTEALRESAFGVWEGMSRPEVLAHSRDYADQLLAWEADPKIAPPEGESIAAMHQRVNRYATELCEQHPGETIVLVSHVGPVKALIAATLGVASGVGRHMFLDPATISVADWAGDRRILRLFNSHAHLGWTTARWMES